MCTVLCFQKSTVAEQKASLTFYIPDFQQDLLLHFGRVCTCTSLYVQIQILRKVHSHHTAQFIPLMITNDMSSMADTPLLVIICEVTSQLIQMLCLAFFIHPLHPRFVLNINNFQVILIFISVFFRERKNPFHCSQCMPSFVSVGLDI